jgi:hypothetical protein
MNIFGFLVKSLQSQLPQSRIVAFEPQPKITLLRSGIAVVLSLLVWLVTIRVFTAHDV